MTKRITVGESTPTFGRDKHYPIYLDGVEIGYWYSDEVCWGIHNTSTFFENAYGKTLNIPPKYYDRDLHGLTYRLEQHFARES